LDPAGEWHCVGEGEPARQLRRRHSPGQLHQRQRVAAGLGHDPVADPRIQRPGQRRRQQLPCITLLQSLDDQFRQLRQLTAGNAGREHQADRLGDQAAGHECHDLG
jgi:hypothetical protein